MLIAEIQGKFDSNPNEEKSMREVVRMEDVLTSNFFGVIKNLDPNILNQILVISGIEPITSKGTTFDFWRKLKYAEPDLIISNGTRVIIVEVKYFSPFDCGDENREHQIVRELKSAFDEYKNFQIDYLAVTRNHDLDWTLEVTKKAQLDFIKENERILHHISWEQIYKMVCDFSSHNEIDPITEKFLKDLKQFFEVKQIGYQRDLTSGERVFEEIFGEEAGQLFCFISDHKYEFSLTNLQICDRKKFYILLKEYIQQLIRKGNISKMTNTIDLQSVPIDLLFNDQIEGDERIEWLDLINFLFSCEYISLNGKNNISASIKFKSGKFSNTKFSLFTYYRKDRRIKFQDTR